MRSIILTLALTIISTITFANHNASLTMEEEIKSEMRLKEKLNVKMVENYLFIDADLHTFGRTMQIIDANGQNIETIIIHEEQIDLDLSSYREGEYKIKLDDLTLEQVIKVQK